MGGIIQVTSIVILPDGEIVVVRGSRLGIEIDDRWGLVIPGVLKTRMRRTRLVLTIF